MPGSWELVNGNNSFHAISLFNHDIEISGKTGWLTADIYDSIYLIIYDVLQCLRVDSITRRIKYYEIWFFFDITNDF